MPEQGRSSAPTTGYRGVATLLVFAALSAAASCSEVAPFIYTPHEFDRKDQHFNKPVTDRTNLTICYNSLTYSAGEILALAETECARFGKSAASLSTGFEPCPLFTPVAARFACVAETLPTPEAGGAPVSGTP